MKSLVDTYHNNIGRFHLYMKGINKMYSGRGTRPIRFSQIVMKSMIAKLSHFAHAVGCFHCIQDMVNIDGDMCANLILTYETHIPINIDHVLDAMKASRTWSILMGTCVLISF